jgi:hypothetical protein
MEALILVASSGGPTMFPRIGIMSIEPKRRARVQFGSERPSLGPPEAGVLIAFKPAPPCGGSC